MSETLETVEPAPAPRPPATVTIRSWPVKDSPWPVWLILGAALAASSVLGVFAESFWFGAAAACSLAAALWRLWLPVTFHVGSRGVVQSALGRSWRIPWRAIAGHQIRRDGILLLTDDDPTLLGKLRGVYVPYGDRGDHLLAVVEHFLRPPTSGETPTATPLPENEAR